jgi:soluble lytic murein transglycosylase
VRRLLAAIAAGSLAAAAGAPPARASGAAIYSFVDERGVMTFTNIPPPDQRCQVVTLRDPERVLLEPAHASGVPRSVRYDGLIGQAARRHQVQPALVKAVIAAESNFDPRAVSRKGARGLMQLMPETAADLGVEDPLLPEENLSGGVRYLRKMIDRYRGEMRLALAAYNAGPAAVDRYGGIPPYAETRDYVQRVMAYYQLYHGDFAR